MNYKLGFLLIGMFLVIACARAQGVDPAEKRAFALQMHNDTLNELYREQPQAKRQIENAAGYATFSNINIQLLFFGSGNGYGVAVDRYSGKKTYMKMLQASAGLGIALKDFREVIIFNSDRDFTNFIVHGWDLGIGAGAGAKSDETGAEATGAVSVVSDSIIIYQLTKSGIELRTSVNGKKYWLDDELNYY